MILSEAEQSLIPHPAQLARKRAAVEVQIIRQLLAVKGISNSRLP